MILTLESIPGFRIMDMAQQPYLRSGQLAKLGGISADTLRHYERMKLLPVPPRSSGNYRLYPPESVERVRLIRHALALGFSLPELARILKVRDRDGAPCREVKRLLEEKLQAMDKQIRDLVVMRDHLRSVVDNWDEQLHKTPEGKRARLLETLVVPADLFIPVKLKGQ
jgi:MerR family transcriptional regulator, copper efflux regulator